MDKEPPPDLSNEQVTNLMNMLFDDIRFSDALKEADDKKLLWLLLNAIDPWRAQQPVFGPRAAIIEAIENRLYPEYDGEKIRMTDIGWSTPAGPIDYIRP